MMSSDQITISIVVPVYKVPDELDRCVESLLCQSYNNIEIILVDDGSPDECPKICDKYAAAHVIVKSYHKENGGLSDARNFGLNHAEGEYVLFVDSDDFIERDTCKRFADVIHNSEVKPDFVIGDAVMVKGSEKIPMSHSVLQQGKSYHFDDVVSVLIPAQQWYAPAWLNMYRRDFLMSNNLFFIKGLLHEDMEFLPRVYMAADKISYLAYTFYNYIIRSSSIISTKTKEKNGNDLMMIYLEWKDLFGGIENKTVQKYLYGYLVKNYIHTCKELRISNRNKIFSLNAGFIIKNSMNIKERIKAIIGLTIIKWNELIGS